MTMKGKVAFITGAASGIGRASALAFAREGAKVMALDMNDVTLAETAALIRKNGGEVETLILNVADAAAVQQAVDQTVSHFGRLDYAHNNAGVVGAASDFWDIPISEFKRQMDINFYGVLHCMQAQIRHMKKNGGGAIVNTASVSALSTLPGISPYAASKHAVLGLTRGAAMDCAPHGIRVNVVCPAVIETPLTDKFLEQPGAREHIVAQHPIGRAGKPQEIAEAVVWLCSDKASYVVGHHLVLDGGYMLA